MSRLASRLILRLVTVAASCALCMALMGASRGAITKLTLDPQAPVVDMFDGMEQSQFDVRLVAQNAHEGRIFITNKTDKPLTVSIPKGLVGVQVFAQPGGFNGFNQFGNQQGMGFGQNGLNGQGQGGAAQTIGGNAFGMGQGAGAGQGFPNPGMNGNGNGNVLGANFFSIPPEKTVQIGLSSVCLNYGKREPNAGMKYQLVKAETVVTDPALQQLLEDFSPRSNRDVQQAAAWHLANGLTWEQLIGLTDQKVPGVPTPLFTAAQVQAAQGLVDHAKKTAESRPKKADSTAKKTETARSVVTR